MAKRVSFTKSSGNVFRDLKLDDAAGLELKAQIARRLIRVIESRGLTQVDAAVLLGVRQPKISALMNGKISGFSVERLLTCLTKLGSNVTITERRTRRAEGRISFATATR
jgi:predicted XRE-type DNA-binding protein